MNHYLRLFIQKNVAVLLLLGFASGLPLALTAGHASGVDDGGK